MIARFLIKFAQTEEDCKETAEKVLKHIDELKNEANNIQRNRFEFILGTWSDLLALLVKDKQGELVIF